jgi:hypothetical protein
MRQQAIADAARAHRLEMSHRPTARQRRAAIEGKPEAKVGQA